jgi:hypothetical protein
VVSFVCTLEGADAVNTSPIPRPFRLLICLALPAALAGTLVAVSRPIRPGVTSVTASDSTGSGDEMARLRDELQLLRRQMQVMAQQQTARLPSPGGTNEAPSTSAPAPTQEEVSDRDRRRFEGLARKLAAEPVDRTWAPATEQLITETLKKPAFTGSKLVATTCHTTLCRFEVVHDTDAAGRKFGSTLPTRLPSLPSGSMRNAEGDQRKTIVYVAREGHRVPRDEPQ